MPPADPIQLTFGLFYAIEVKNGLATPAQMAGVRVCVVKKRGYLEPWSAFVDTIGPCSDPSPWGENVILHDVPALSELVVLATKEGYLSRAFAVTTGLDDQKVTGQPIETHLFTSASAAQFLPNADLVEKGQVVAFAGWPQSGQGLVVFVGGVGAAIDPPHKGEGPYYIQSGRVVAGAMATFSGGLASASVSSVLFTNLPGGEYVVKMQNAPGRSPCRLAGVIGDGQMFRGYKAEDESEIRTPVLPGCVTEIAAACDPAGADAGGP